jgi:WD40 repeat protein
MPPGIAAGPRLVPLWRAEVGDAPLAMAFSRDGAWLAVASGDGEVVVLDSALGRPLSCWAAHGMGALAVDVAADGLIATGGQDGQVAFWRAEHEAAVQRGEGAPDGEARRRPWVEHVRWSPDGQVCATAAGAHVALWNADGSLRRRFAPIASTVADLQWLPDGQHLSAVGYGGVTLWHRDREVAVEQRAWKGSFLCHAWAPTGRWLAAGMQESAVHIFEVATKGDLEMSGYSRKVQRLSWSADGKRLITNGGAYGTVWNFAGKGPAGTTPISLPGHALPVADVAFHRQGLWVATAGEDGQVLMWDLTTSSKRAERAGFFPAPAFRVGWHPRERRVVSLHQSGHVLGWPTIR